MLSHAKETMDVILQTVGLPSKSNIRRIALKPSRASHSSSGKPGERATIFPETETSSKTSWEKENVERNAQEGSFMMHWIKEVRATALCKWI